MITLERNLIISRPGEKYRKAQDDDSLIMILYNDHNTLFIELDFLQTFHPGGYVHPPLHIPLQRKSCHPCQHVLFFPAMFFSF